MAKDSKSKKKLGRKTKKWNTENVARRIQILQGERNHFAGDLAKLEMATNLIVGWVRQQGLEPPEVEFSFERLPDGKVRLLAKLKSHEGETARPIGLTPSGLVMVGKLEEKQINDMGETKGNDEQPTGNCDENGSGPHAGDESPDQGRA